MPNKLIVAFALFATFAVAETKPTLLPTFVQKELKILRKENRIGYARPFGWGIAEYRGGPSSLISARILWVASSNSDGNFGVHFNQIVPDDLIKGFYQGMDPRDPSKIVFSRGESWIFFGNEWVGLPEFCSAMGKCRWQLMLNHYVAQARAKMPTLTFKILGLLD